jgi:sterol desaturase/sphingolipid hydroxylase (fatty acid hydroxylase superfamily)
MDSTWLSRGARLESYVFLGAVFTFAVIETFRPLRPSILPTRRRWLNHGILLAVNTIVNVLLFRGGAVVFSVLADSAGYGLFHHLTPPYAVRFVIGFAAVDLAHYASHFTYHRIAILWRIHRVHHTDPEFDITTSFRFHPVEGILTQTFLFAVIALLGPPPLAVLAVQLASIFEDIFEHANVGISPRLDRFLRLFLVTPNMHRVHHSALILEQNSNFGTILPWWDRLFGTYSAQSSVGEIGLDGYPERESTSVLRTLGMPFEP